MTRTRVVSETDLAEKVTEQFVETAEVTDIKEGPRLLATKRMTAPYLNRWDAAIAEVKAGTRDAKLLTVGDSTTAGVGGGTEATYVQQQGYPSELAALLNEGLVPAADGLQIPRATSAGTPNDTRWTRGTGWVKGDTADTALTSYIGFGGRGNNYYAPFDAAGVLTFNDPRINADRFDVYYLTTTGDGATFTAQATGGAASAAIATGAQAAKGIAKVTISAAAAITTNVVTIDPGGAAGQVFIVGIEPWLSTRRQVRVANAGASGSKAFSWAAYSSGSASNTWNALASIKAYAPDLTIIDLGINDADPAGLTDPNGFDPLLQSVINAALVSGDVILKTFIPVAGREAHQDLLAAKIRAHDLPLIDIYSVWDTGAKANAAELVNPDLIHANAAGYEVVANYVYAALTRRPAEKPAQQTKATALWTIDGPAGTDRTLAFATDGVSRWLLRTTSGAETGANAGSDLVIVRRADNGAALGTVVTVYRSNGRAVLGAGVDVGTDPGTGTRWGTDRLNKQAWWGAAAVTQPAAIPNTSGADLASLEAEVNKLKALVRTLGFMAT
ncbi:SGNH/GDSL hydrolase family protein [Nocardioides sp. AX2bis]|uniref:SGNH/GDSL hydrolase family protein n=1 Tax=Nocardioides sp. AX2bis TaxID=2653157 RepID=UPI0012F11C31|nr:SGNH/GDSL hydrolase family protein [Nocardioides sp. AX2bis]VXC43800.1 hypothetical protein NOCARDAX2BIS_590003 [Nocardioides sp. AX2bis]